MSINAAFKLVIELSRRFDIDESHALKHSMEVYAFTRRIIISETPTYPDLVKQREIIYLAAILHDMCDKKYTAETDGVAILREKLRDLVDEHSLWIIMKIITTMSYSTVKKDGYPELGEYQMAYHVVREADLLAAYDIDRCIMYSMYTKQIEYDEALWIAVKLFYVRVLKYKVDGLFITDFSKQESEKLHENAVKMIALLM